MENKTQSTYRIHSTVMSVSTREKRHALAGKRRWVQHLGGGDITVRRNRPAEVSKEKLLQHLEEISRLEGDGLLEIRTVSGQRVDLLTFKAEPVPVAPPLKAEITTPLNTAPAFGADHIPTEAVVAPMYQSPSEVSLEIQQGVEIVTHSVDKDPAKRRKQRRGE